MLALSYDRNMPKTQTNPLLIVRYGYPSGTLFDAPVYISSTSVVDSLHNELDFGTWLQKELDGWHYGQIIIYSTLKYLWPGTIAPLFKIYNYDSRGENNLRDTWLCVCVSDTGRVWFKILPGEHLA